MAESGDKISRTVSIKAERDLYYDNEEIRGEVTFNENHKKTTTYRSVMIILWARYIEFVNGATGEVFTIHMLKRPVAHELVMEPGETKTVPFTFTVPANSPPSVNTRFGAVQWRVALVHENASGRGVSAAASKLFRKASLYHSLPAFVPTAQNEVKLVGSGNMLRAEARLSKDVYSPDEEVQVHITVHEADTHKVPTVTGVKAKVMQHMWVRKNGKPAMRQVDMRLAKVTSDIAKWDITHLTNGMGTVAEHTLSLTPTLDSPVQRPRCAYQIVQRADYAKKLTHKNTLPPTCKFSDNGKEVLIQYEVLLEVRVPSGNDIILTLPFVLQSAPEEALRANTEPDEEFMFKVPMFAALDDELPEYEDVGRLSLPTYSSLRRNSVDTVFANAAPAYEECEATEALHIPATSFQVKPAGRRHSMALFSPPAQLPVPEGETPQTARRSRRASLSVFGFLGKDQAEKEAETMAGSATSGSEGSATTLDGSSTPQSRPRRKSVSGMLLETTISATATRTLRRLRAPSQTQPPAAQGERRRPSMRVDDEPGDSAQEMSSLKARYAQTPQIVLPSGADF